MKTNLYIHLQDELYIYVSIGMNDSFVEASEIASAKEILPQPH
ncbi:hypothetical protein [Neptunitalea chrysea]|nr:hypothetical protein [Neptunitalea chrysea]